MHRKTTANGTGDDPSSPVVVHLPLADLVEDLALYPRHAIDGTNVKRLLLALEAGATLPPIVACATSKRIVDGWHRGRAYRRALGPEATVPVELRHYANEAALFRDAVALNAHHGRRLDKIDQVRIVTMATRFDLPLTEVSAMLSVPEQTLTTLRLRVALVPYETEHAIPGTLRVALKNPVKHLEGRTLSESQAAAVASAPGTSYKLLVAQLRQAIEQRLLDATDRRLLRALAGLQAELAAYLADLDPDLADEE